MIKTTTTVTCDCCGKEVIRWIEVYMTPNAKSDYMNVADLLPYNKTFQVCEDCIQRVFEGDIQK